MRAWRAIIPLALALAGSHPAEADIADKARAAAEDAARPPPREPGPFTIDELMTRALAVGPQVLLQQQEVIIAEANARAARAARIPDVTLQGQLAHQTPLISGFDLDVYDLSQGILATLPVSEIPTAPTTGGDPTLPLPSPTLDLNDLWGLPEDVITLGFKVSQPLFTSGRISHGVKATRLGAEVARSQLEATGAEVAFTVQQVALGLFAARDSAALLDEMATQMAQMVVDVKGLRAQGLVTDAEVLAAEASHARLLAEGQRARAQIARAVEGLRQVVGLRESEPVEVEGDLAGLPTPDIPDEGELMDVSLMCRADLAARRQGAQLAVEQVYSNAAQLSLRPTVALSLEGGLRGLAIPVVTTNWQQDWGTYVQAAAVMSIPLMDGGKARAQVEKAKAQATQAHIGAILTEELVRAEVRQYHAELVAAHSQAAYASAQQKARFEAERVARRRFEAGDLPRSDYITAWMGSFEARAAELGALMELHVAALALDRAAGLLPRTADEVKTGGCGASPHAPPTPAGGE